MLVSSTAQLFMHGYTTDLSAIVEHSPTIGAEEFPSKLAQLSCCAIAAAAQSSPNTSTANTRAILTVATATIKIVRRIIIAVL